MGEDRLVGELEGSELEILILCLPPPSYRKLLYREELSEHHLPLGTVPRIHVSDCTQEMGLNTNALDLDKDD